MKIGVLALQGAFREHKKVLEACGCDVIEVRKPEHLSELSGLVIPGGESTTIGKLLGDFGLMEPIRALAGEGLPIFATCAGMIVLAKEIENSNQPALKLMDIKVKRNAFGRQVDSFEVDLAVEKLKADTVRAIFIRAPYITEVAGDVQVLATHEDKIVLAEQNNLLAAAFHPELTNDYRLHEYFVEKCRNYLNQ